MSVLLEDEDGTIKLLVKGADSIIKSRLNQSTIDANQNKVTEDFLDTASK
jgi:magnesium-transporting ATPase (P-type)